MVCKIILQEDIIEPIILPSWVSQDLGKIGCQDLSPAQETSKELQKLYLE